jgi:FMN phosphatase YigB (HAD superfamily)
VGKNVPRILINRECVGAAPGGGVDEGQDDEDEAEAMLRQHPQYSALRDQLAVTRNEKMRSALQDMLDQIKRRLFGEDSGLFDFRSGRRDVFVKDDCDNGVRRLAKLIGVKFARRVEQLVEEDRRKHPRAAAKDGEVEAGKGADKVAQAIAASANAASKAKDDAPKAASSASAAAQPATSSAPAAATGASASSTKSSDAEPSPLAIGFDFDHTLGVDHGLELNALRLLSADLGKAECCSDEGFRVRMERALKSFRDGLTDQSQLMQELQNQLGLPADASALRDLKAGWQLHCMELATKTEALPGATELLRWLRAERVPYAIYTNGWSPLQAHKVAAALGDLAPPKEAMLVSDVVGSIKPARGAFDALRRCPGFADLPPKSVWYVGDNAAGDVGGAMKAGLTAVWLDAEGQTYPANQPPPDHTVASLTELRPIIEAELKKLRAERKESASGAAPTAAAASTDGSPAKL